MEPGLLISLVTGGICRWEHRAQVGIYSWMHRGYIDIYIERSTPPGPLTIVIPSPPHTHTHTCTPPYSQARSHEGGSAPPPGKIWAPPPRLRCPFCRNYRYWGLSPLEFCQPPPLLTIYLATALPTRSPFGPPTNPPPRKAGYGPV